MVSFTNMSTLILVVLLYKCSFSSSNKDDAQLSRTEKELLNLLEYILDLRKDLHQERIERKENIESLNRTISHSKQDCQGNDHPPGGHTDLNASIGFGLNILENFGLKKIESLQRGFEREKNLRIIAEKRIDALEKKLQLFEEEMKAHKALLTDLNKNIGQVQANVVSLKIGMGNMASNIGSINTDVLSTKDNLKSQKAMVMTLEDNIGHVHSSVSSLKVDMNNISTDVRSTKKDHGERLSNFETGLKIIEKDVENKIAKVLARSQHVAVSGFLRSTLTTFRNGQKIVFDDVYENLGNSYQSSTGVFTAPVAGLYIALLAISSDHNPTPEVDVVRNGVTLCRTAMGQPRIWTTVPCTAVVHLHQGDQIWAQVAGLYHPSHSIRADLLSSFSIGLISPD